VALTILRREALAGRLNPRVVDALASLKGIESKSKQHASHGS
jgi:hypothetical protein